MPNFKPKTFKNIKFNKNTSVTLDGKHKEFLNEFSKDEKNIIPKLKMEKLSLLQKLEIDDDKLSIEQKLDMQDRINELKKIIKETKNKKKEYLLNNSKYIFDYFENKKNISDGLQSNHNNDMNIVENKNQLLKTFFKIQKEKVTEKKDNSNNNNNIERWIICDINDNKITLMKPDSNINDEIIDDVTIDDSNILKIINNIYNQEESSNYIQVDYDKKLNIIIKLYDENGNEIH